MPKSRPAGGKYALRGGPESETRPGCPRARSAGFTICALKALSSPGDGNPWGIFRHFAASPRPGLTARRPLSGVAVRLDKAAAGPGHDGRMSVPGT